MNIDQCANCLLHGWNQVEDLSTLQRCKKCKFIKYCGRDCQTEHWLKVHHKHCKYFADPVKAAQWEHKEDNCVICHKEAVFGRTQLKRPDNPNYSCIFKLVKTLPPGVVHPHPFPAAGDPGDTFEKSILVLWQLLDKFWHTQPEVVGNYREDFEKVFFGLMRTRIKIWVNRKIVPKPQLQRSNTDTIPTVLFTMDEKVEKCPGIIPDPFQLWKIIKLVRQISLEVDLFLKWNVLINPLVDMPSYLQAPASKAASNSPNFLATAKEVLDALTMQVIPHRDVLSIICGGSVKNICTFCSKSITITDLFLPGSVTGPFALFGFVHATMFCCESNSCRQKGRSMIEDSSRSAVAMSAAVAARGRSRCDFCFKLPPSGDVHRCGKCFSVMYCSTDCRDQDWDIHKKVCKEDVEERKKKFGRSARKKEGKEALESLEKNVEKYGKMGLEKSMGDSHVQGASEVVQGESEVVQGAIEVVGKFRLKKSKK